ncbi:MULTISPECIES: membrane protein insertion efficiency factor YidD [unclassified Actinomyces]|uniref:membrane protein insertion efficiency factor YidD n=1 Tax=Actinomyces sp. 565 TaxID=2057794 RepID=UPI001373A19F|nr:MULTISPECIES: membrane protein insertion efficiency factor YidD [unclassified Actinomyces]MBW3069798.1 membrane protein insertion efficiency factor YidD [Actinomyces sp. 594]NDR54139.1 membrane protein insertion efficiency factor YidD [Actinomyces sp. 565]QHO92088.1 membrane protein insertion efficiency factor YidD [Actinomyces sp. 432]
MSHERSQSAAARALVALVGLYQGWISPGLPRRCRYYPSCSAYAVEAVKVHGALKGALLAAWRLLRCNPLTRGGVDHVPDPGRWRYHLPADVPRFYVDDCDSSSSRVRHGAPPGDVTATPAPTAPGAVP